MSMRDIIKNSPVWVILFYTFLILCIGIAIGAKSPVFNQSDNPLESEQFGGAVPMNIYTIYDRDTGVYYAVTEKGGITPMYTIEGEVKLVDQGNEYVIHKNLGSPHAQE